MPPVVEMNGRIVTPSQPGADGAVALQRHRGAKPFEAEAIWTRRVSGIARVTHGRLAEPRFRWEDIDE